MREKLKAWLRSLLAIEDIDVVREVVASSQSQVANFRHWQYNADLKLNGLVEVLESVTLSLQSLESRVAGRLADIEEKIPPVAQLQADIRLVQEARREIEALRHEMAQRPGVIKTRTASEFRKQMEAMNGQ